MKDSLSLIRNSVRSSERLLAAWITSTLNIITGSKGGRHPVSRLNKKVPSQGPCGKLRNRPRRRNLELIAEITETLQPSSMSRNPAGLASRPSITGRSESNPGLYGEVLRTAQFAAKGSDDV